MLKPIKFALNSLPPINKQHIPQRILNVLKIEQTPYPKKTNTIITSYT